MVDLVGEGELARDHHLARGQRRDERFAPVLGDGEVVQVEGRDEHAGPGFSEHGRLRDVHDGVGRGRFRAHLHERHPSRRHKVFFQHSLMNYS